MGSFDAYRLPVTKGQKFTGTRVSLDDTRFEDCTFQNCDIIYSGGPAETSSCYFENVRWVFEGSAGIVVQVMQGLGWKIAPPK
jgi:hypothetical protein